MKSVAFLAIVLAVFTVQQVSANWSNSSNSSNHSTATVTAVFDYGSEYRFCNVSAHFNHQDDVIIQLSGFNSSNYSQPILNITNLAGNYWIQNASGILSVLNRTNSSVTYRFRYYSVFMKDRPCALTNNTMTCRFKLTMPTIHQSTDLYFTFDQPYSYMPAVKIVGSGYDNTTNDTGVIWVGRANLTEYLKSYINLTASGDYFSKDQVRYLNWNASNFNASWMMSTLKPKYLGFQCWGNDFFNLIANWTGEDGIYRNTPVNLSRAGLLFDNFYSCNMTIVFTERSNEHALIPIQVRGVIYVNGSQSNHSNSSNTTQSWGVYAGYNKGCNISAEFTRWDGVDLTLTSWSSNQTVPMLNLTNYAGWAPVANTSNIFRPINHTSRSITYRFNYWNAIGSNGPCVSYDTYSVGCRFKLWMSGLRTDIYVTITKPFLGQNISIHGSGYNNRTWENRWIDVQEANYTENLLKSVNLTVSSDYFSQSRVRYLNWNTSNFNASWMMATLKPVALGFQCTNQNGSFINVVANYTGSDGIYPDTPVNLSRAGLPCHGHWSCNMSVIATEQNNNHAMIEINVRNNFYINGSANYSGNWNGPQQRSNFSEYRRVQNSSFYANDTYYNYTYYNHSQNNTYKHGNASWYSHENPYYSNQSYNYNNTGGYNYSYYNQSRYNNQSYYGYNSTYYNQSRYGNQSDYYRNSSYNASEDCNLYENRLTPYCLEKKVSQAKLINKVLIGCVGILAIGLFLLACKVCCCQKKSPSRENSPQNSYVEFANTSVNTPRQPQIVMHNAAPVQAMPVAPGYLVAGQDGTKFMVIPQKV